MNTAHIIAYSLLALGCVCIPVSKHMARRANRPYDHERDGL